MTERVAIRAERGPAPLGPYSQAMAYGGVLYCSGVLPIDDGGELVEGSPGEQARRCLGHLETVCEAAGTSLGRALLIIVYATELAGAPEINEAYAEHFSGLGELPARVMVGVAGLPKGAQLEIAAQVAV